MTLKTLAAAACVTMATATTGFAAPINLDFQFDGGTGTFFGLDDADGSSSASSFDLVLNVFGDGVATFTAVDADPFSNFSFFDGEFVSADFEFNGPVSSDVGFTRLITLNATSFVPGNLTLEILADGFSGVRLASSTITPVSAVPLPAGGLLLLTGLGGVAALKRRKKRAA